MKQKNGVVSTLFDLKRGYYAPDTSVGRVVHDLRREPWQTLPPGVLAEAEPYYNHLWIPFKNKYIDRRTQTMIGWLQCECGYPDVSGYGPDDGWVTCSCNRVYSWSGQVIHIPPYEELANRHEFPDCTPEALQTAIKPFIHHNDDEDNFKYRMRIWFGDTTTGRAYSDDRNTAGYLYWGKCYRGELVSKVKIKANKGKGYGDTINLRFIVRLDLIEYKLTLYQHENFHVPDYEITNSYVWGTPYAVVNPPQGQIVKRFETIEKAERFIDYLKGERYNK